MCVVAFITHCYPATAQRGAPGVQMAARAKSTHSTMRGREGCLRVGMRRASHGRVVVCSSQSKLNRDAEGRVVDENGWVIGFDDSGDEGEVDEETAKKIRGESRSNSRTSYTNAGTNSSLIASVEGTHYEFMGLNPSVDVNEIRQKYRQLSKKYHPDTTELETIEAGKLFLRLQEAYDTLSVPEKRQYYDWRLTLEATKSMNIDGAKYSITNNGRRTFQGEFSQSAMDKLAPGENLELSNQAQFSLAFDVLAFGFCMIVVALAFILPESDISGIQAPVDVDPNRVGFRIK